MPSPPGPPPPGASASWAESATVNAAGLVQGIALVTFPAASTIFTARGSYDLSSSQYGLMFVPQVLTAVTPALLGAGLLRPGLARRLGERTIYLAGLLADLAAMLLLIVSWLVAHQYALAYALLCSGQRRRRAGLTGRAPSRTERATGRTRRATGPARRAAGSRLVSGCSGRSRSCTASARR